MVFRALVALLMVLVFLPSARPADQRDPANGAETEAEYARAVADARSGSGAAALDALRALVERFPERTDILGDYIVVLGWQGEHAAALALADRIDQARAPLHVMDGLAGSARRLHRFDVAESLYRTTQRRFRDRFEPQVGLLLTLADAGQADAAAALAQDLAARFPKNIDVLEACAYAAFARRDYFGALQGYQAALVLVPGRRDALRGKIQTLARLGAPQLALELADRNPSMLNAAERTLLGADSTAHRIRWGTVAADIGRGEARFGALDAALAASDAAAVRALDATATLTPAERELALDRVSALRERYRMRDAVTLYQAMAARALPVPAYVQSAAASAYLYLEQPERACDLYRAALQADPANLEAGVGLFYALAESEQHGEALAQIERVAAATPLWIDAWSPVTVHENPAYIRVQAARAMAPLFANRPGEAESRLHALSDAAPHNTDVRTDYASVMRARGWPRKATAELGEVLAVDQDNSGALGERAGGLLEQREYGAARRALAVAQTVAAEDGRVVRAARLAAVHDMRELVIDGSIGRSSAGPAGTRDFVLDARLYSGPMAERYRVFGHAFLSEAKFDSGTGRREREGMGLQYRSPLWVASGEIAHGNNDGKTPLSASFAFTPDDSWTFGGAAQSSSNETPLQATLAGIDARRVSAEAVWRAHESRSAALSLARMNFSDGNRREIAEARWSERVVAGPVYRLSLTGALYVSRNSAAGTSYFNPSRDYSPTVEFENEWLQWRRYTRAFRHRVIVSAGSYWQQSFGAGGVAGVRYEQEWEADDRISVRYGIGRSRHPYDGVQTARSYGYLHLNWRF